MAPLSHTVAADGDATDGHLERTSFLKVAMLVMLMGALTALAFQHFFAPDQKARVVGPTLIIVLLLVARLVMARGRPQAALHLMLVGVWCAITISVALSNGVHAPIVAVYPLLIVATGWLVGPAAAMVMTAITILAAIALALAEQRGLLPLLAVTPIGLRAGTQVFVYTISAVLVVFAMRVTQRRQARLHQVHRELVQRTVDLETSRAELSAAQTVASVGSWVYDFTDDTMHLSDETCRIFGLPQGSTLGRSAFFARVHRDDREAVRQACQAAVQGAAFDTEYRITVGDGKGDGDGDGDGDGVRWIRSKADLKFANDGSPCKALGIAQDITQRRQIEAALLGAKAEAEQANRAKSSFLTAVSHDLGQPVSALTLLVGMLQQQVPQVPKRLLQNMQECVKGISALLADLVEMGKLDAGVVVPSPTQWSVHDMLAATVAVHTVEAQNKGLHLRLRATDAWTCADRHLVQRMVGNLVSNAIRYTQTGGVLVACRMHAGKPWIEVWDTGIGIPHDKSGLVFQEFAQLNVVDRFIGSGLGLSIVAKTSQLLGLQVRLRSVVGKGSMFAVELPPCPTD